MTTTRKPPMSVPMQQRERSLLSFNRRVLAEAQDDARPLLERLKFLGIVSSNLDEFFRVRFGAMTDALEKSVGLKRQEYIALLATVQQDAEDLQQNIEKTTKNLLSNLEKESINFADETKLSAKNASWCRQYFYRHIWHYTTIYTKFKKKILSRTLDTERIYLLAVDDQRKLYALIGIVSAGIPRFIELPSPEGTAKHSYMWLDDVLRLCCPEILASIDIMEPQFYCIKCSRNAELSNDIDLMANLVGSWEKKLSERRRAEIIRVTYDTKMPQDALDFFVKHIDIDEQAALVPSGRYHNMRDFISFDEVANLPRHDLQLPQALTASALQGTANYLEKIKKQDVLLFLPYQSFRNVTQLLQEAAISPKVKAICMTLYRVADDSAIIRALINALRNGKQVSVLLELSARFDERANLGWLQQLNAEGAHIIVGPKDYKVHAKICLIEGYQQSDNIAMISTGNFNEKAAKLYSDIIYLTANQVIVKDLRRLFGFLQNPTPIVKYKHLLVAPRTLRTELVGLIKQEISNAKLGKPAYIHLKLNNLTDQKLLKWLDKAARVGVQLKLNVRSSMGFNPDNPAYPKKALTTSIVDSYLEHSRILAFCNNDDPKIFLSSADWMTRNMNNRIEIAVPILEQKLKDQLIELLNYYFADNVKGRVLCEHQANTIVSNSLPSLRSQEAIYHWIKKQNVKVEKE